MQSEAEKLVEEVARAIYDDAFTDEYVDPEEISMDYCRSFARAAIALVAERAAKVVETFYLFPEPTSRAARYHLKNCVRPVLASEIRSLSPEAPQPEAKEARDGTE